MQSTNSLKVMLLLFALALSTAAFAGEKGNFQISDAVQVNGTTLPAGDYVARWDGAGPTVQVNITRNGRTVATVPAKLVQLDQKVSQDAAEIHNLAGGRRELTTLQFSGKKYSLQLGGSTTAKAESVK
jgi:hypothetical protein